MATTTITHYEQWLDHSILRKASDGPWELQLADGSWKPVTISEQDYDHLKEIPKP